MRIQRIGTSAAAGLLACVVMATGCSSPNADPSAPPTGQPTMTDPQGREIVMVVDSEAALREDYSSIRELAASTSVVAIVRGVVSATRDVYSDRLAFRILTVDVTQVIRGQVGRQISVLEDGGVVPYAAVKDDLGTKDNAPTAPARTDGYVDFRFMGARHSEAGDDVVLFLGVNPNSGTAIDSEYYIVSSVHGRFTLDPTTRAFVRGGSEANEGLPGFVTSADLETITSEVAAGTRSP